MLGAPPQPPPRLHQGPARPEAGAQHRMLSAVREEPAGGAEVGASAQRLGPPCATGCTILAGRVCGSPTTTCFPAQAALPRTTLVLPSYYSCTVRYALAPTPPGVQAGLGEQGGVPWWRPAGLRGRGCRSVGAHQGARAPLAGGNRAAGDAQSAASWRGEQGARLVAAALPALPALLAAGDKRCCSVARGFSG